MELPVMAKAATARGGTLFSTTFISPHTGHILQLHGASWHVPHVVRPTAPREQQPSPQRQESSEVPCDERADGRGCQTSFKAPGPQVLGPRRDAALGVVM